MEELRISKQWRITQEGDQLHVAGGQDAIYTIELEDANASFFAGLAHGRTFRRRDLSSADGLVLEQLLTAAVIEPVLPPKRAKRVVQCVGLESKNGASLPVGRSFRQGAVRADVVVLVRTHQSLGDFLRRHNYAAITKPHLFLDIAYNHTVSLGPLVFPGVTSCVACLEGRLKTRWGDATPPPHPAGQENLMGIAKEWLAAELDRIFEQEDYSLVNKTVTLNVQDRTMATHTLLTVPLCAYCQKNGLLSTGKVAYNFMQGKSV